MRRIIPVGFLVLSLFASPTHAMEMFWSHRDLVIDSDVIVVATLTNTRAEMKYGLLVEEGDLSVERVLCGNVKAGDTLRLRWENYPNVACPRVEHSRNANQSLLWLLERGPDGSFRASTNQKARSLDEVPAFLDTLAAYPYRILTPQYDVGDRATFTITFRNATTRPVPVPTIQVSDSGMVCGPGFDLILKTKHDGTPLVARPGTLVKDDRLAPTTLAPGTELRVEVPFSDIVGDMVFAGYWFDIAINGRRMTQQITIRSPWMTGLERVRGTDREFPYYIQTIRNGGPTAQTAIMMLEMASQETAHYADELMSLSDSLDTETRLRVIQLLTWAQLEPEPQMDFYLERFDDPSPEVRASMSSAVGFLLQDTSMEYRREEATALLMFLLDDEAPRVRHSAAASLGTGRVALALSTLEFMAEHDVDLDVRKSAREAANRIENPYRCGK